MGRAAVLHEKKKRESELIRYIVNQNWDKREVLGRLLRELDIGNLVSLQCEDNHGPYALEGRVVQKFGKRLEMREDMHHPDGLKIEREDKVEIVPYNAIKSYEILTFKTRKVMGVED